jgi:hypothetical protein
MQLQGCACAVHAEIYLPHLFSLRAYAMPAQATAPPDHA